MVEFIHQLCCPSLRSNQSKASVAFGQMGLFSHHGSNWHKTSHRSTPNGHSSHRSIAPMARPLPSLFGEYLSKLLQTSHGQKLSAVSKIGTRPFEALWNRSPGSRCSRNTLFPPFARSRHRQNRIRGPEKRGENQLQVTAGPQACSTQRFTRGNPRNMPSEPKGWLDQ